MTDHNHVREKDKLAMELGKRGGLKTLEKKGRAHFREIAYKSAYIRRIKGLEKKAKEAAEEKPITFTLN